MRHFKAVHPEATATYTQRDTDVVLDEPFPANKTTSISAHSAIRNCVCSVTLKSATQKRDIDVEKKLDY